MDDTMRKRVFAQMYYDAEITDLNIPPMKMPKTLKSLLSIGYSSDRDSPTKSGSSSNSDDSSNSDAISNSFSNMSFSTDGSNDFFSTNTSTSPPKEWGHIFAEDSNLRFDKIIPVLPPMESKLVKDDLTLYRDALECSVLALAHYNANNNEGAEYELVAPLLSNLMHDGEHFFIHHVNFIAKPKNADSHPQLFYAEVVPSNFLKTRGQNPVVRCCILTPHLCGSSPGDVVVASPAPIIHHPPDVDCVFCTYDVYADFD